jgi:hypothetical protein
MVEIVDDRLIMDDFMILNSLTNAAYIYRKFLKLFQDIINNDSKEIKRVIIFLYDASDGRLKILCYLHLCDWYEATRIFGQQIVVPLQSVILLSLTIFTLISELRFHTTSSDVSPG